MSRARVSNEVNAGSSRTARSGRARRGWAVLAAAALALGGQSLALTGAQAQPPPAPVAAPQGDKVNPDVTRDLEEDGRADFWIRFAERPDLSGFASVTDWDARGQGVYDALTSTAARSQAGVRARLDAQGVSYHAFSITNAIRVDGGTSALVGTLSTDPAVEGIYPTREYEVPEPVEATPSDVGPAAVEWGLADVNADDVWAEWGITGEGIVVGNIDTGVQYDHPALVGQYRGNNGDGTFTHDYNWFDAAGESPDEPSDFQGHGTHTMGTMVGSDGGDNQIGMAPGATWIAANGCCPSDEALIASGEWMLAPTKLDGSDPDPGARPNIINNSWGSTSPSNDPFMEDVALAWEAAGIFGVWANGNIGPACNTSGSPGSRIINYSVGNYDIEHAINGSSSRGVGQDGETKPNLAAPGTAVRSSVPGNDYELYTGTSMAAPHVAGAIALLWATAPALVGDVSGTKDLLDGTAVDNPDDQCGGTDDDNNVFGEGRLDALALVEAAPTGEVGTLAGTVTDSATGDPLPGAAVAVTGPLTRNLVTRPDGSYQARLTAGEYSVQASKFGYVAESDTALVTEGTTVTVDFALEQAPSVTVTGTVTDGSGHGFPLYARVGVSGQTLATYTDPVDGTYSLTVPADTYLLLAVVAQYPGYQTQTREMSLGVDAVEDFAVPVDAYTCVANGYRIHLDGTTEGFDELALPPGWTIEDDAGTGQVWVFDDPAGRGNQTGGEGGFAIVDSDFYGMDGHQDTSLVSPSMDFSDVTSPAVGLRQLREVYNESADVDVSIDGGATWENVVHWTAPSGGPVLDYLALPSAAGQADVKVRFHYYDAFWGFLWQVDDVFLGERSCLPDVAGGYVVGNVYDTLTGDPVRGAKVTSLDNPSDVAVTKDTPSDTHLDDGFYWLFSHEVGVHPFEATARLRSSQVQDVTVPADGAVRADFELGGGLLSVSPDSVETHVVLGESASREVVVTNEGDASADIEVLEVSGDFTLLRADGTRQVTSHSAALPGAPVRRVAADVSYAAYSARPSGSAPALAPTPAEPPWEMLTPLPAAMQDQRLVRTDDAFYSIGGIVDFEFSNRVFRYDNATMEWSEVAPVPEPVQAPVAGVVGGVVYVAGGWSVEGNTVSRAFSYDPGADTWSAISDSPVAVSAGGQAVAGGLLYSVGGCTTGDCEPMTDAVMAYDPGSDTWSELAPYPVEAAFISCGGIGGMVYCTGGVSPAGAYALSFVYDPSTDSWSELPDAPSDSWGSAYAAANGMLIVAGGVMGPDLSNEAFAFDAAAGEWVDLPNPEVPSYRGAAACGFVKAGGSVGFDITDTVELLPGYDECGDDGADVSWLSVDPMTATLAPGESVTLTVTTDGDVPQPGVYTAGIRVAGGVPGSDPFVPVTMTVDPPLSWGKLLGQVTGVGCEGDPAWPLAGAAVDVMPTQATYPRWHLVTDEEGRYARWFDTRIGEVEVIASMPEFYPVSDLLTLVRGAITVRDYELLDVECEPPTGPLHPEVGRLSGSDRYLTAVKVSQQFAPGVHTVFVATGEKFPDALAAAARAGHLHSPVLLTPHDRVPSVVRAELLRLQPQRVVLVGGLSSIDAVTATEIDRITADAPVRRLSGANRYETAAKIAAQFGSADIVFVATGENFPDALAGSARAGALHAPLLLVEHNRIPAATRAQLSRLEPEQIVLLGGTGSVSSLVRAQLGGYGDVDRVAGADRYETAALLARDYPTAASVYVSSGLRWPDALSAAARAGGLGVPVILVRQDSIPASSWAELDRLDPSRVWVTGGPSSVSDGVLDQLRTLE